MLHSPILNQKALHSHSLVEFVDVFPTIVDIAGLEVPPRCSYRATRSSSVSDGGSANDPVAVACTDGISLRPLWSDPERALHATALQVPAPPPAIHRSRIGARHDCVVLYCTRSQ